MDKVLGILMILLGLTGFAFGAVMTVMAIRFGELGRVIFYGMIALFSAELLILGILKTKRKLDK